jgi:hypothetical protein
MITFHVWLTGQNEPQIVRADMVRPVEGGALVFLDRQEGGAYVVRLMLAASAWQRWEVVHDESDHSI